MNPVAITAAAAVTSRGFEWRGLGQSLLDGPTSAPMPSQLLAGSYPGTLAYELREPLDEAAGANAKQRKIMSRSALLAAAAVQRALRDAGWNEARDEIGLFLGVGGAGGMLEELEAVALASVRDGVFSIRLLGERGLLAANPLSTFQLQNNFTLCHSAIIEGLRGPNAAFATRGSGSIVALAEAMRAVSSGDCERALAGGSDTILHPLRWAEVLRDDWTRQSLIPGEGAAVVALGTQPGSPLAMLESCELRDASSRSLEELLLDLDPADCDLIVIAPAGQKIRESLKTFVRRKRATAACVDVTAGLGECFAATAPIAWLAALDLIAAGRARRALVLSAGVDGQLGIVRLCSCSCETARQAPTRKPPRAVVTGVGVVSAFGAGSAAFFSALAEGRSGVGPIRSFDASTFPVQVAAEVPVASIDRDWMLENAGGSASLERWIGEGALRDRKTAFALVAASEAWRDAGCTQSERDAWLCLALGLEQSWAEDFVAILREKRFDWSLEAAVSLPNVRMRSAVDLAARRVHEQLRLRGPTVIHGSACAAGTLSLAHAASLIESGEASVVVCGGTDSMINPLAIGGFARLGACSPRNAPDACRPFDLNRDGLVIGEGAAIFVVEREDRAKARGARLLARIVGWGSTQDAYRATMPRPDGACARRAMQIALRRSGRPATAIGWINAHGTGTPLNDLAETRAIRGAFGAAADRILVSSIKGAVGHLMAASGAIEAASCLLPFVHGVLPGTAHHRTRDPECDLDVIGEQPRRISVEAVLSNSFGFGGQNASIVLERP